MGSTVSLLRRSAQAASAVLLAAPATASEAAPVREYQAMKSRDGKPIHLTMYRKRPGGTRLPVLFLVHGSSMSALSSFHLQVPAQRKLLDDDGVQPGRIRCLDHGS